MQRIPRAMFLASIGSAVAIFGCAKSSESHGEISDGAADTGRVVSYEIRRAEGGKGDSTGGYDLLVHHAFRTMPFGHVRRIVIEPQGKPLRVVAHPDSGVITDTTHLLIKSPVPIKKL